MSPISMTPARLAGMIDNTLLKADATEEAFRVLCRESADYGFQSVAVNGAAVERCKRYLEGTGVLIDATVGFPLGQATVEAKVFEARDAMARGAAEIDYVVNQAELKNGNAAYVEEEMRRITEACRQGGAAVKVIFENCNLSDEEKRLLCEMALRVRPDFIKTSTGFGSGGATLYDVYLMKSAVGDAVKIKAAGGIRDLETALAMIKAGADRIGTSAGAKIMQQFMAGQAEF